MITEIVIAVTTVAVLAFDVYIIIKKGKEASISRVLYNQSRRHPVIPFALGFVAGHIFWANC